MDRFEVHLDIETFKKRRDLVDGHYDRLAKPDSSEKSTDAASWLAKSQVKIIDIPPAAADVAQGAN